MPGIVSLVLTRCAQWASARLSRMIPSSLLAWSPPNVTQLGCGLCLCLAPRWSPVPGAGSGFTWHSFRMGLSSQTYPRLAPQCQCHLLVMLLSPTLWVTSRLRVDSDLEHDLGKGLGSLSPCAAHSPSCLFSPSLQFRNKLSSLRP